ncbi:AbiJ-NTD4 domain-containing protein [Paludibaculum fermentans]|uniref:AbiJ-NTD4 domain-containing protein n=1 Tax=Paludibaculum fermentans TaxID=1473598 RepID=UPI003EC14F72
MEKPTFSKRLGYTGSEAAITIREDAPEFLRYWISGWARKAGLSAQTMRSLTCELLRVVPDSNNWSDGNVAMEVDSLLAKCPWYRVYDIIEAFSDCITRNCGRKPSAEFMESVNGYFREEGIGWKLENGAVVSRGDEEFESQTANAAEVLSGAGYSTATEELHQARADLSRRPTPDLTGAIQHAMAAMECVAREFCEEPQPTFGKLIQRHPYMLPPPLNQGVEKAWGYASEMGRHVREGRMPDREEAELVVGIAATVATYLTKKKARQQGS